MGSVNFDTSVRYLNGVGEKRAETLAKPAVCTCHDDGSFRVYSLCCRNSRAKAP